MFLSRDFALSPAGLFMRSRCSYAWCGLWVISSLGSLCVLLFHWGPVDRGFDFESDPYPWLTPFLKFIPMVAVMAMVGALVAANQRYLASRFLSRAAAAKRPVHEDDGDLLLPSRQEFVAELSRAIRADGPMSSSKTITIPGARGSGKSYVLDMLTASLQRYPGDPTEGYRSKVALVQSDIWAESSEPDLHFALYENLLSQPHVIAEHRWGLDYSPMLGVLLFTRLVVRCVRGQRVQIKDYSVRVELPGMMWQSRMEDAFARMRREGYRIVWLLDEIDRAPPEIVQAAFGLVRRGLSQQGVTIVMPYVESQVEFKAFHPAMVVRSDIASTLYASIYTEAMSDPLAGDSELEVLGWSRSDAAAMTQPHSWRPLHVLNSNSSPNQADPEDHLLAREPYGTIRRNYIWESAVRYNQVSTSRRRRIHESTASKYLSAVTKAMPSLTGEDLANLLWCDRHLRGLCGIENNEQLGHGAPGASLSNAIKQAWNDICRRRPTLSARNQLTPRVLISLLQEYLGGAQNSPSIAALAAKASGSSDGGILARIKWDERWPIIAAIMIVCMHVALDREIGEYNN
ncbi:MAG: hypothetical protein JNM07_13330 [Phycisphaerae bacterium]|nr:hypothetical protein [Phycisphaerae bacterium]